MAAAGLDHLGSGTLGHLALRGRRDTPQLVSRRRHFQAHVTKQSRRPRLVSCVAKAVEIRVVPKSIINSD